MSNTLGFQEWFAQVAKASWRAFVVVAVTVAYGVLAAPDLSTAKSALVAGGVAAAVAVVAAIQALVPRLYIGGKYGAIITAGVRDGLVAGLVFMTGWLGAPDVSNLKAVGIALVVAVGSAFLRGVQGFFTGGESPAPNKGT